MAQHSRSGGSGSRSVRGGESRMRLPKQITDEQWAILKSWFDVDDSSKVPTKVAGFCGYIFNYSGREQPTLSQWKVWALHHTEAKHKNLAHLWLYHAGIRGSRGDISSTQDSRIAEHLLTNWDSLLADNSNLLDGSKEADKDLETIASEPLLAIDHKDVIKPDNSQLLDESKKADITLDLPPKGVDTKSLDPIRVTQKLGKDPVKVETPAKPAKAQAK